MEYYLDEQLKAYFEDQIAKSSNKKISKLRQELDERRQKELTRLDDEVRRYVELSLGFELKELKSQSREDINLLSSRYHLELMQKREALVNELFDAATKQILGFVSSPKYLSLVSTKLDEIIALYPKTPLIISIASHDTALAALLAKEYTEVEHRKVNSIKIGGFTCTIPSLKIEINETLDQRLVEKRNWFYQQSKLFVKE